VYSGTLEAGSGVYNSTKDKKERVGRLLRMHANKKEEVPAIEAGDIAAAIGLKLTTTGDTLCDPDKPIVLEAMTFPEPVIAVAIEPKTRAVEEKLEVVARGSPAHDPSDVKRYQRQALIGLGVQRRHRQGCAAENANLDRASLKRHGGVRRRILTGRRRATASDEGEKNQKRPKALHARAQVYQCFSTTRPSASKVVPRSRRITSA